MSGMNGIDESLLFTTGKPQFALVLVRDAIRAADCIIQVLATILTVAVWDFARVRRYFANSTKSTLRFFTRNISSHWKILQQKKFGFLILSDNLSILEEIDNDSFYLNEVFSTANPFSKEVYVKNESTNCCLCNSVQCVSIFGLNTICLDRLSTTFIFIGFIVGSMVSQPNSG